MKTLKHDMMENKLISVLLICTLFLISCSDKNNPKGEAEAQNKTPEVLDNSKADDEIGSFSKRISDDILQQLFEEAINKDTKLKDITTRIDGINQTKSDSLKDYNTYIQNYNEYWSSVNIYINQISDSTLKGEMRNAFNILESNYKKSIAQHTISYDKINVKATILNDQEILMKLLITEPMMKNYQHNKLPDIKRLNRIIVTYDTLINETKPFIKIHNIE